MKILVILNDPPYGTERSYNGLRLAGALSKREGVEVRVFLFGDAVGCALGGKVPAELVGGGEPAEGAADDDDAHGAHQKLTTLSAQIVQSVASSKVERRAPSTSSS